MTQVIDIPHWLSIYLCLNILAFLMFASDKLRAQEGDWRISESALLWMTFAGSAGAFAARRLLRHKTRKEPFRTRFRIVAILHLLAAIVSLPPIWPMVLAFVQS